jgi:hypothetical protein
MPTSTLQHISGCAGPERPVEIVRRLNHAEQQHPGRRQGPTDGSCRCQAVYVAELEVHEHEVGAQLIAHGQGRPAAGRFTDDLQAGYPVEQTSGPCSRELVVVDNYQPHTRRTAFRTPRLARRSRVCAHPYRPLNSRFANSRCNERRCKGLVSLNFTHSAWAHEQNPVPFDTPSVAQAQILSG